MTAEQYLRLMIGDMALQLASVRAENDALKEAAKPKPDKNADDAQ